MKDFLEGLVTVLWSLDMSVMWNSDYGRERYAYAMLNLTLFIIDALKITDVFLFCLLHDRLPLKVPNHIENLKKFLNVPMPRDVRVIVEDCGLFTLMDCLLTILDASQLKAFVERWHKETSYFHLSFGEMTITLDDVSSLFHLFMPISFFTAPLISRQLACITSIWDIGVTEEEKFRFNTSAHFRLSWLMDRYAELVQKPMYEATTRG